MNKKLISFLFSIFLFLAFVSLVGCNKEATELRKKQVVVYTYDSFISEWGPAPVLEKLFEEHSDYDLVFISVGDAAQVLSKATVERANPRADVLIGIDNNLFEKAKYSNILEPYVSHNLKEVPEYLLFDDKGTLTPFDWSNFALIYDTQSDIPEPKSLLDLTNEVYNKKIILMDPRTSTPGLGFVAWTLAQFGDATVNFWYALRPNILTMAPGWDTGYGLFTSGEAPLVISYTTSPAYHVEYDETDRYKALIFEEGHPYQIEGAGIVKRCKNPEGAKAFIDFLLSEEAQSVIPLTQWMYPVVDNVLLPDSYKAAPKASKNLSVDAQKLDRTVNDIVFMLNNAE